MDCTKPECGYFSVARWFCLSLVNTATCKCHLILSLLRIPTQAHFLGLVYLPVWVAFSLVCFSACFSFHPSARFPVYLSVSTSFNIFLICSLICFYLHLISWLPVHFSIHRANPGNAWVSVCMSSLSSFLVLSILPYYLFFFSLQISAPLHFPVCLPACVTCCMFSSRSPTNPPPVPLVSLLCTSLC